MSTTSFPYEAVAVAKYKPPPGQSGLSFGPGDELRVLSPADDDGDWLNATDREGNEGLIPSSSIKQAQPAAEPTPEPEFVEEAKEQVAAPAEAEAAPTEPEPTPAPEPEKAPSPPPTAPKSNSLKDRLAFFNQQAAASAPPAPRPKPTIARKPWQPPPPSSAPAPAPAPSAATATPTESVPREAPVRSESADSAGFSAADAQQSIGQGGGSLKDRIKALQGVQLAAPGLPGRAPPKPWKKKTLDVEGAEGVTSPSSETGEEVTSLATEEGEAPLAPIALPSLASGTPPVVSPRSEIDEPIAASIDESLAEASPNLAASAVSRPLESPSGAIADKGAHIIPPLPGRARPPRKPRGAAPPAPAAETTEEAPAAAESETEAPKEASAAEATQETEEVPVDVALPVAPEDDEDGFDGARIIEEAKAAHAEEEAAQEDVPAPSAVTEEDEFETPSLPKEDENEVPVAVALPTAPEDDEDGFNAQPVIEAVAASHEKQDSVSSIPSTTAATTGTAAPTLGDDEDDFDTPDLPKSDDDEGEGEVDESIPPGARRGFVREMAPEPEDIPSSFGVKEEEEDAEYGYEQEEQAVPDEEEIDIPAEEEDDEAPPPVPAGRPPIPKAFVAEAPPAAPVRSLPLPPPETPVEEMTEATAGLSLDEPQEPMQTEDEPAVEEEDEPKSPVTAPATSYRPAIPAVFGMPRPEPPVVPPTEEPEAVEAGETQEGEEDEAPPVAPRQASLIPTGPPPPPPAEGEEGEEAQDAGDVAEGEEAAEAGEGEAPAEAEEEAEEEDPELVRRRNLAARMARLGGVQMMGGFR